MDYDDGFFSKSKCDRCSSDLQVRTMSWFNNDTICMTCCNDENKIKSKIKANGADPSEYEGCGYIPKIP